MVVKIGIIKCGNIGTSPVIDLLLDERADRPNIDTCVIGSGAKMNPEEIEKAVPLMLEHGQRFRCIHKPKPRCTRPC